MTNVDSAAAKTATLDTDYLRMILNARVYDAAVETPLTLARNLSDRQHNQIYLKREDLQPVFSFKIRGAYNKIYHLTDAEKAAGVVACSAGNHAQGVALSAKRLGIQATIVMPLATPAIKWKNVRRLGAEVVLHGNNFDEAKVECDRLAALHGWINIPPYDDPYVIAGQGTVGVEILRQITTHDLKAIFCSVGGGGLAAGVATYVKRIRPDIKVIGVETLDADAMTRSLEQGNRHNLVEVGLFADGTAVKLVGQETFRLCQMHLDGMVLVSNDEICAAIKDVPPMYALFAHSFLKLYETIYPRNVTEFSYRYSDPDKAYIFMSFIVNNREQEIPDILAQIEALGMKAMDISDNEMAKSHARYLVGGRCQPNNERMVRFQFPERPGALKVFLESLMTGWNVSLFHYRNVGGDIGKVLAGIQVPSVDSELDADDKPTRLQQFLDSLGYPYVDESENPIYQQFLC
ncbi:threonine deaminase [Dimargaris verticillata]|uniref:threonine ammonia-lyase n=1 Tax=Dimargaris verticillata TaxID=2761393 RepID=A0A9W8B8T8_9FUNG|nr:threonine deaminase [Dimargaris verticillata]